MIGYEFLREHLRLSAFPCAHPARIANVAKVVQGDVFLEVPASVAPATPALLEHLLFALKHEGINLQILAQALPQVPASQIAEAFTKTPASKYLRMVAYLWEQFTGQALDGLPAAVGPYVDLFDATRYITGKPQRNTRWRVDFNGLGSIRYCPTVERTPLIAELLEKNTLQRAQAFISGMDPDLLERTMSWSYLSETESSFAIERETPTPSKAEAFAELLKQAHDKTPITEAYLVQLQNLAMTNPLLHDVQFRNRTNWLRGSGSGVLGVTYVPPEPDLLPEVMEAIMDLLNNPPPDVSPLVMGAIASFAFVFAHPFMDGNGRLSRFLFHKAVCQSRVLQQGLVLPVSIAMSRHESGYLRALKSFSSPARKLWDVVMIDESSFDFEFRGDATIYRYWDATPCVEFGLQMAEQSLEVDLRQETDFLQKYDAIYKRVSQEIDLNNNNLSLMVRVCLQNKGQFSNTKRKYFLAKGNSDVAMNVVEKIALEVIKGDASA